MSRKKWLFFLTTVLGMATCLDLLPWVVLHAAYLDGEEAFSAARLSSIGAALHAYYEDHGRLPPATVTDKDGRPLYSWRVLLLPYLDLEMAQQFRLEEPWDGPHNQRLLKGDVHAYCCRVVGDGPGLTRYKAFVGPGTAFDRRGVQGDDLAETILVVEAGAPVFWSQPADLTYDPARPQSLPVGILSRPAFFYCFYLGHEQGYLALFGNGTIRFLRNDTDERTLRGFILSNAEKRE